MLLLDLRESLGDVLGVGQIDRDAFETVAKHVGQSDRVDVQPDDVKPVSNQTVHDGAPHTACGPCNYYNFLHFYPLTICDWLFQPDRVIQFRCKRMYFPMQGEQDAHSPRPQDH